jgi:hypothetical protein
VPAQIATPTFAQPTTIAPTTTPTTTPTDSATSAEIAAATAAPTDTPTVTATPTITATSPPTATPTATPVPIDLVAEAQKRLPAILLSAIAVLGAVVLVAGVAILRGPRDI